MGYRLPDMFHDKILPIFKECLEQSEANKKPLGEFVDPMDIFFSRLQQLMETSNNMGLVCDLKCRLLDAMTEDNLGGGHLEKIVDLGNTMLARQEYGSIAYLAVELRNGDQVIYQRADIEDESGE